MSSRRTLKLASRIHILLEHELGKGVDAARLITEPLYRRDVLLVCDAMRGTEGPQLAREFRAEMAAAAQIAEAGARENSGFSASRFFNSVFGLPSTESPPLGREKRSPRSWFARLRK